MANRPITSYVLPLSLGAKTFQEHKFDLNENERAFETHFHKNGCAR